MLCYDADRAGQTAAERSSELLVSEGFDVNVVQLPGGEDPDTFIQKQGRDAFVAQLKQSRPYLEYLLDRAAAEHDLTRDDSRREFLTQDARRRGAHSRSGGRAISLPIAWRTRRGSRKPSFEPKSGKRPARARPSCRPSGCRPFRATSGRRKKG